MYLKYSPDLRKNKYEPIYNLLGLPNYVEKKGSNYNDVFEEYLCLSPKEFADIKKAKKN